GTSSETEETIESDDGNDTETTPLDEDVPEWRLAAMTWYESYPDEGSAECIEYNGCTWAGWFAGLPEQMSPDWVESHNIAAVHEDHFDEFNGKTLRVRKGDKQIDVVVYDMCSDADCDGCCTDNMWAVGFLIDMEIHTADRFGVDGGAVEFICLDCDE
ncbi:MAG: hypothetical protein JXX14_03640, partial [Deltaproteobacteria bacterium]|nr:hypothetical protein [Deltaproteobacteria bacterium]